MTTTAASLYRQISTQGLPPALSYDGPKPRLLAKLVQRHNEARERILAIQDQIRRLAHLTPPGQTPPCEVGSQVNGWDILDLVFDGETGWWAQAAHPEEPPAWLPWQEVVEAGRPCL